MKGPAPTEDEWEYAARGGNNSGGYIFSGSNTIGVVAWYHDNSNKLNEVGHLAPNELGINDMSGNVSEWCSDYYDGYSNGSETTTVVKSTDSDRVYRGGNH